MAKRFNGEVINSDALQLYEGLPIVTNKLPPTEMCGIRHHLLGRLAMGDEPWTVSQFTSEALSVVEDIRSRGKVPILVGGTHYYTQSLLVRETTLESDQHKSLSVQEFEERWPILKGTDQEILSKLQEVDPDMAARWHPNDRRRIRRSLEIYLQSGVRASEVYASQRETQTSSSNEELNHPPTKDHSTQGDGLRFATLTFYTHLEKPELEQRIADRVDEMLAEGLVEEVRHMHACFEKLKESYPHLDPTRGIWPAIGYKEFGDFIAAQASQLACEKDLTALRESAIERTKIATRQYARRQMRWIKHRLIPALLREGGDGSTILLPGSEVSKWSQEVEKPAVELSKAFLHGEILPVNLEQREALANLLAEASTTEDIPLQRAHTCEICGTISTTEGQMERHSHTTKHRRALRKQRRAKENAARLGTAIDSVVLESDGI